MHIYKIIVLFKAPQANLEANFLQKEMGNTCILTYKKLKADITTTLRGT